METAPTIDLCCTPIQVAPLSDDDALELAALLKALADPVRLRIVSIVASAPDGECCACDLPDLLDRSQPTVSHHLAVLTKAGVLHREQRGKWAWFRLNQAQLGGLASVLGATCC